MQEFDLTFQDYESTEESGESSEEDVGTGRTEDLFHITEPVTDRSHALHKLTHHPGSNQLMLFGQFE